MMQVKRYVAPSFAEALIMAKNELGTDAMIVESKKLKVGGFLGLFARTMTELTVAIDKPVSNRPAPSSAGGAPDRLLPASAIAQLEREVASLRTSIARLIERGLGDRSLPSPQGYARQVYDELVAKGVDEAAALDIAQRIPADGADGKEVVRRELARLMGDPAPIELTPGKRKVVALIGPTGVGKTTTLAKLAAHFSLMKGAKVGLITSDTFRIAAVEQLRTYADILGIPLHAVESPAEVALALKETAGCDLVLVDTGGRNHKDERRMQELRDVLSVLRPDETHLVYSLTANPKDSIEALDYYLPLGVNRLTFTKLDEASSPGLMLNLRIRCNQPLSYLTNGQSVPDDLIPADQADYAKLLLGA